MRTKNELRDVIELVLVPGLAAVLPWRWCFRLYRWLAAHCHWLYRESCDRALREAATRIDVGDAKRWLMERRLVTLVDHADYYLGHWRSDRWMDQHLSVEGAWPESGATLLCTFHWGAGMWGLRHAARSGIHAHALVAATEGAHFVRRTVMHRYAIARTREVARALRRPTFDVSASLRPVIRALRDGSPVLAVVDIPADEVDVSHEVSLLGMRTRMAQGMLRLAVDQQLPVVVYLTGIRLSDGHRFLRIHRLPVCASVSELLPQVFVWLERALQEDGVQWHFWGEAPRFFVDVPPTVK
ncbi:hypothetical protein [Ottowia sp.]|uniref:hypothetical protein n=1 Tax=Ottowia sp. TaxID=1898956 RepID=UPI003A8A7982